MNPVIEAINKRRSVRSYHSTPIPKNVINTIIEAGNQAPSTAQVINGAFKFQPWRFVVVEDPVFKQKLLETTMPIWMKSTESMKQMDSELYEKVMRLYETRPKPKDMVYHSAPVILFVIGPESHAVSCALACENIMLAATSLGLGNCYVGFGSLIMGNTEIAQMLELTEKERIYGPILLGYPKDDPNVRFMDMHVTYVEPKIKWI